MANRAYFLNTQVLTSDLSLLNKLADDNDQPYEEVAEGANLIPVIWLLCFRQSDVQTYQHVDEGDPSRHEERHEPCASVAQAIANLQAALPRLLHLVGNAGLARTYWEYALNELRRLPYPFVALNCSEVVDGDWDLYIDTFRCVGAMPEGYRELCAYEPGFEPYALDTWRKAEGIDDQKRRYNTISIDGGFYVFPSNDRSGGGAPGPATQVPVSPLNVVKSGIKAWVRRNWLMLVLLALVPLVIIMGVLSGGIQPSPK